MMSDTPRPIRRVVTGNDAKANPACLWDSAAPNAKPARSGPAPA